MRKRRALAGGLMLFGIVGTTHVWAQDPSDDIRINTMRPVIRGRTMAAASMKPEATQAAERLLRAGGNAFDAAVGGQAVLGIVDAASNGVGSDAVILVWDAKTKKVF
jgi:gamma-glutamyltranspeptidase/glutathione hydrolase